MSFSVPRSDRRTSGVGDFEQTDVARNIGSLLRFGKVQTVDYAQRLCRVELNNGLVTDLLPWLTIKGGGDVFWNAPSVDETVLLLSPSGELNNAVVLPALQHHTNGTWPYNFSDLSFEWGGLGEPRDALWRWLFKDGALLENDPERHQFRIEQVQSRVRGQEIAHLQSDKLVYIDGDVEGCVVHVKAPFIKLEGDVQITGQLLQGGRIVGTEPDGEGLKELQLVGDPIKLNGGGGPLGIAASLIGTLAAGGFALGGLGSALSSFGNIGNALSGLATNVLGSTGMGSLLSSLPISGIGSALSVTGALPVLGELMNGLGFTGAQNIVGGALTLVNGVTSGSGLKLDGVFQGLSSVTDAINTAFPNAGLGGLSDITALGSMATSLTSGNITINNVMDVLNGTIEVTGFTPPAGVDQALNIAMTATNTILDGNGNTVAGPQLMGNAMDVVMGGLRDTISEVTDEQLADRLIELGLATAYEGLKEGEVNAGEMIGHFIGNGSVSVEQVLDMAGVFMNGADPAVTAAGVAAGTAAAEVFFEQFNREQYRPSAITPRDTSDKAGSETDPRVTQNPDYWSTEYDSTFT